MFDLFEPSEGGINFYYGRIGNGKTYAATADVLESLSRGEVNYVNWVINYKGFDETKSFTHVFFKSLFFRSDFYKFPPENLIYFSMEEPKTWVIRGKQYQDFVEFLNDLNDCNIWLDEGQWLLDSYEGNKFSTGKRKLVLHTRHLNRSLNIISQRTQAVQVSARGQVNRFFKCEKKMEWPFLIFRRTEYQDMKDNDVDESEESVIDTKTYFASKQVMDAYDTKYLRAGVPRSQEIYFEAYRYTVLGRFKMLMGFVPHPKFDLRNKRALGISLKRDPVEGAESKGT